MSITNRTAFMKNSHLFSWNSLESSDSDSCSVEKQQTFIGNPNPSVSQWTLALPSVSPLDAVRVLLKNDCFPYLRNLNEILSSLEVCDVRQKRNEKTKPLFGGIKNKTAADFSKSIHVLMDCFCGRLMREIGPFMRDNSTTRHMHSAVSVKPEVFLPLEVFTSKMYSTAQRLSAYRSNRSEEFSASPRTIQWVQLAGHEGSLISTGTGSVLKPYSVCEATCLRRMSELPALRSYVPQYQGDTTFNGKRYLRMQDLLYKRRFLSVMDCKIGQRTYTEDEVTTEETSMHRPRADMYEKMIALDPDAPTLDEHRFYTTPWLPYRSSHEIQHTCYSSFSINPYLGSSESSSQGFRAVPSGCLYDLSLQVAKVTERRWNLPNSLPTMNSLAPHFCLLTIRADGRTCG
ncbi:hypothetical protein AHF37_05541 [Paragonimus kellicotti]|nr:hypothetical protein AHF37_05541 [Paragonimus kellicotti]